MKTILPKRLFLLLLLALGSAMPVLGQSTVGLDIDSGDFTLNNYGNTTPLAVGDVLQFGYYTGAGTASDPSANPFSGTWMALTGNGSVNSGLTFTIIGGAAGSGAGPGQFGYSDITFTQGSSTTGVDLPSAGQIMAIRFYNGTTVASSTAFGSASDSSWDWIAPGQPAPGSMTFSLSDPGVTWIDNDVAYTGVPEPSVAQLSTLGLILLAMAQRKLPGWAESKTHGGK